MKRTKGRYIGYIITNTANRKEYIGITKYSIEHRWNVHIHDAKRCVSKYKSHLHNAINKYGETAFKIETKVRKNTWEEICAWEKKTIEERNSKTLNGYNLTDGGEGAEGIIRTPEFKKKLSKSKKEFYSNSEKRKEQSVRMLQKWTEPKRRLQKRKSKILWKDPIYVEKTIRENRKRWEDPEMKQKHALAIKKSTTDNPKWMKKTKLKNKEMAKDPKWRKKVSEGLKNALSTEEARKKKSKIAEKYWEQGHDERRKKHAKIMSEMINQKLKDPEYQRWRKENPPGAKPIMYQFKYFRSLKEVAQYFNISYPKVDRDLLKQKEGCLRLDPDKKKEYDYEIKY